MKRANSKYEIYFQLGRTAFLNGLRCAPVSDTKYMDGYNHQWKGAKIGDDKSKDANEAAKAWIGGWAMENLKAGGFTV